MIIVNQNKDIIINLNKVEMIGINPDNKKEIYCIFGNGSEMLGEYETEERAKEVLREITTSFSFTEITGNNEELKLIFEITKLGRYEMPPKQEVTE